MKKVLLILLNLILLISIGCTETKRINNKTQKVEYSKITKEKFLWKITGTYINNTRNSTRGYITIQFIDKNADILGNAKAKINDSKEIHPGQSADFQYNFEPDTHPMLFDVIVHFKEFQ